MLLTNKILTNQVPVDITVQELGDVERLFEMAQLNGISITDDLTPGDQLISAAFDKSKKNIVQLFKEGSNKPASGHHGTIPGGIGYMQIGTSFKVS